MFVGRENILGGRSGITNSSAECGNLLLVGSIARAIDLTQAARAVRDLPGFGGSHEAGARDFGRGGSCGLKNPGATRRSG